MPAAARPPNPAIPEDRTEPPDLCGVVLDGRYRVDRPMGRGGMGSVYAGEQLSLGRPIAIKVVRPGALDRDVQVKRLVSEAKTAAMVRHPNVIEVIDVGLMEDRFVYLVMEHLQGTDLRSLLRAEGKLGWARTRNIVSQVVDALGAAHAEGVIHRDVKPSNCFLVEAADPGVDFVKVVDFGLAKRHRDGDPSLTGADQVVGTATYLAPEVARGKPADARSEVYSVGVLMYKMLTSRVPFTGATPVQVLAKALSNPVTPPRTHEPTIPRAVDHLIRRCLSKRPEQRPSSMAALQRELDKLDVQSDVVAIGTPTISVPVVEAAIVDSNPFESSQSGEVIELRDSEVISIDAIASATRTSAPRKLFAVPNPASSESISKPVAKTPVAPTRRRAMVPPSRALVPVRGAQNLARRVDAETFDFDFEDDQPAQAPVRAASSVTPRRLWTIVAAVAALTLLSSWAALHLLHPRGVGVLTEPVAAQWARVTDVFEKPELVESDLGAASLTMIAGAVVAPSGDANERPALESRLAVATPIAAAESPVVALEGAAAPTPVPANETSDSTDASPKDAVPTPKPRWKSKSKRSRRKRSARRRPTKKRKSRPAPPKPRKMTTAERNAAPWMRVPTPATRQKRR